MDVVTVDKASVVRCIKCGKHILEGIRGTYEGDKQCDRCGTNHHIKLGLTDFCITYDTIEYIEQVRE